MKKKFKSFRKKSGTLIPFSIKKSFPLKPKRIFFVNGKKNFVRGNHAHKKCSQFLFPLLGKTKIQFEDVKFKKTIILDYKKKKAYYSNQKHGAKSNFLLKTLF